MCATPVTTVAAPTAAGTPPASAGPAAASIRTGSSPPRANDSTSARVSGHGGPVDRAVGLVARRGDRRAACRAARRTGRRCGSPASAPTVGQRLHGQRLEHERERLGPGGAAGRAGRRRRSRTDEPGWRSCAARTARRRDVEGRHVEAERAQVLRVGAEPAADDQRAEAAARPARAPRPTPRAPRAARRDPTGPPARRARRRRRAARTSPWGRRS